MHLPIFKWVTTGGVPLMADESIEPYDFVLRTLNTRCRAIICRRPRHVGVELNIDDWQTHGFSIPLLTNVQPAGKHLCESFHRAGGVPVVMGELLTSGILDGSPLTVRTTLASGVAVGRATPASSISVACAITHAAQGVADFCLRVTGKSVSFNVKGRRSRDNDVIRTVAEPLRKDAGFRVVTGNLFDAALMKTSVISPEFTDR
eukprot:scaffold132205_cov33-Tisochrysis_lutea.AAC.4